MAAKSSSILRRALLYVPASSPRMLTKSLGLSADNVTYDLEDSVTAHGKADARAALRTHLASLTTAPPEGIREVAVRINAVSTPHALADLSAVAAQPAVDTVVVPKVQSAGDLVTVTEMLRQLAPDRPSPVKILALIESARAVMDLREICGASPYLSGLIFAAEDFALDLSLTRTPSLSEFAYARGAVAVAARAFGLPSTIDLVCTSYKGQDGEARLVEECEGGRAMGFNGKQCIHPAQVATVQRLFAPATAGEVEWAVRVLVADGKAAAAGRGAWTLDGAMIDAPVVGKARSIVDKARQCDMDVDGMWQKWKDQEPE
ncbi:beta subunit of citrate lyase [Xylariomycetidae sp. FL0641]|nr:beta subunit of citrate lyase [Xylariomycetidae sp. FL0641]